MVNKLYKKSLFKTLRFNENMIKGEDTELSHLILFKSNKLVFSDERLYFYFRRGDGLTHRSYSDSDLKNVDQNLLKMFEKKIRLAEADPKYTKIRISSINDLLSYNIELYNKAHYERSESVKKFRSYYRKYAVFSIKNFKVQRTIRFLIFYISPPLYYKLIRY